MGNYWEPADPSDAATRVESGAVENPEAAVLQFTTSSSQSNSGVDGMIHRSAGSGGTGGGAPANPGSGGPSRSAPPPGGNRPGGGNPYGGGGGYQPDERYWTDYLRIAFPVIGILLMLGLFWFWANELIGDDDDNKTPTTVAGQTTTQTPSGTEEANSPPLNEVSPTSQGDAAPTETPDSEEPEPSRTPRNAENSPTPDDGGDDDTSGGNFAEGDTVVTNDSGVRLRSEPVVDDANIIQELDQGVELTVTGPAEEDADGNVFIPVEDADGQAGYVAADFIDLA